ncbi:hypothetical protein JX580_08485 [Thiomicrospira microaerophila]|uniref:hypothetical protein n=1 Tax=Thiomicrospira microaerophila TaxID=406020 RepID=UPI00200F2EC5|nr:hypothetical protein [Thiomicrospira microaerophila]UQB41704.1 hypothetical protein JX580_08485 [Thiomicrospira microaerophila]
MTVKIKGHAKQVVERFKIMLDDGQTEAIGDEHFSELETLIEAALGVVYSQAEHDFAKELEELAHRLRKKSSSISKD